MPTQVRLVSYALKYVWSPVVDAEPYRIGCRRKIWLHLAKLGRARRHRRVRLARTERRAELSRCRGLPLV